MAHLRGVDPGFNPSNLLTVRISLPPLRYNTDQKTTAFFEDLVQRVEASPGVRSAAVAWYLPLMALAGVPVQDAAQPPLKLNERPIQTVMIVTPGYFHTLGIALQRGRDFSEADKLDSQIVTIIDERLARQFWPSYPNGPDPVGQHLLIGGTSSKPVEIVGVVERVSKPGEHGMARMCV